jgi:hypothetical protein
MERITAITHASVVTPMVSTEILNARKLVINGEPFDPFSRRRLLQMEGDPSWSCELQQAENERMRDTLARLESRLNANLEHDSERHRDLILELADQRATIDRLSALLGESLEGLAAAQALK